jgi:hypothetical protein
LKPKQRAPAQPERAVFRRFGSAGGNFCGLSSRRRDTLSRDWHVKNRDRYQWVIANSDTAFNPKGE